MGTTLRFKASASAAQYKLIMDLHAAGGKRVCYADLTHQHALSTWNAVVNNGWVTVNRKTIGNQGGNPSNYEHTLTVGGYHIVSTHNSGTPRGSRRWLEAQQADPARLPISPREDSSTLTNDDGWTTTLHTRTFGGRKVVFMHASADNGWVTVAAIDQSTGRALHMFSGIRTSV